MKRCTVHTPAATINCVSSNVFGIYFYFYNKWHRLGLLLLEINSYQFRVLSSEIQTLCLLKPRRLVIDPAAD